MSLIKSAEDIIKLRESGRRLAGVMASLIEKVAPGMTGRKLDRLAGELISELGDRPSFLNYQAEGAPGPYTAALCVSINDEIVHGTPTDKPFQPGDVISLDLGLNHLNFFSDMARTVAIDPIDPSKAKLISVTSEALSEGINRARPGNTLGDIGYAIESVAKAGGYGVVRDLGGHGVGHRVHEEPHIPNFGKRGKGLKLKPGMVLAIEPMFTLGGEEVDFMPDGYLVKTTDGSTAAHFENTILITDSESEILTRLNGDV